MNLVIVLPLLLALPGADDPESAKALRERLVKLHEGDALEFTMYRDASRKEPLEFRKDPVYVWTNPVRSSQQGAVFVWTSRGRPEAIATIFSSGGGEMRGVAHEFHSLSLSTLTVDREGEHKKYWRPRGPGIELVPIDGRPHRQARRRSGWGNCAHSPARSQRAPAIASTIATSFACCRSRLIVTKAPTPMSWMGRCSPS